MKLNIKINLLKIIRNKFAFSKIANIFCKYRNIWPENKLEVIRTESKVNQQVF